MSNPLNTDTEGAIKGVRTNGVSVLSGVHLIRENIRTFFRQGQGMQTVRNNWVSLKRCLTVH